MKSVNIDLSVLTDATDLILQSFLEKFNFQKIVDYHTGKSTPESKVIAATKNNEFIREIDLLFYHMYCRHSATLYHDINSFYKYNTVLKYAADDYNATNIHTAVLVQNLPHIQKVLCTLQILELANF